MAIKFRCIQNGKKHGGRSIHIAEDYLQLFYNLIAVRGKYQSFDYEALQFFKEIRDLSATAATKASDKSTSALEQVRAVDGGKIHYVVINGSVFIRKIIPTKASMPRSPGMYSVSRIRDEEWMLKWVSDTTLADTRIAGNIHYVAVNGKTREDSVDSAAEESVAHMCTAYTHSKSDFERMAKCYSLFYTPIVDKNSRILASRLAAVILDIARSNREVRWTVIGEGSQLFNKSMERLLETMPSTKMKEALQRQTVHFSHPKSNVSKLDKNRAALGFNCIGKGLTTGLVDLSSQIRYGNYWNELLVTCRHTLDKSDDNTKSGDLLFSLITCAGIPIAIAGAGIAGAELTGAIGPNTLKLPEEILAYAKTANLAAWAAFLVAGVGGLVFKGHQNRDYSNPFKALQETIERGVDRFKK